MEKHKKEKYICSSSQEQASLLKKHMKLSFGKRINQKLHIIWMDIVGLAFIANERYMSMLYKKENRASYPSVFRFSGLEYLLEKAKGLTILDVGMQDGLVDYEFARHGAKLIHGIDNRLDSIGFCRRLFRQTPCESKFIYADLIKRIPAIGTYDIVLFLNIYFWLKKKMSQKDLDILVRAFLRKAKRWFVVRGGLSDEVGSIVCSEGFAERFRKADSRTCIYERVKRRDK